MTKPERPESLKDLDTRLAAARAQQDSKNKGKQGSRGTAAGSGMGFGFRISMDIIVALVLGVGLGLVLDRWLGTSPWLLIVFFFLGAAAGMLNVYRTATGQGFAVGYSGAKDEAEGSLNDQNSKSDGDTMSGSHSDKRDGV